MANYNDRDFALEVLKKNVTGESLLRHALTVEAVMRYFAEYYKEQDIDQWGVIGLLHDIDFERFPEQHCFKAREILTPYGYPNSYIRAIESHGYGLVNDVKPIETMEKVLYATDELTGLIAATAIMRPSRSILDLEVSSVKKKWKQKGFAAAVNREVIVLGAEMLGLDINKLIELTIMGMRPVADEIGLKGNL